MDFLARKPLEIDCLPTRVCIEFSRPIESPNALLRRVVCGGKCTEAPIPLLPTTIMGCSYYFTLPEYLKDKISTGRYQLILQEDCDYCSCLELQFIDRCFIIHHELDPQFAEADCPACTMEITE